MSQFIKLAKCKVIVDVSNVVMMIPDDKLIGHYGIVFKDTDVMLKLEGIDAEAIIKAVNVQQAITAV